VVPDVTAAGTGRNEAKALDPGRVIPQIAVDLAQEKRDHHADHRNDHHIQQIIRGSALYEGPGVGILSNQPPRQPAAQVQNPEQPLLIFYNIAYYHPLIVAVWMIFIRHFIGLEMRFVSIEAIWV